MKNDVHPFKGLSYNPDIIENIGMCLSQPYDVITPEQQEAYYHQHEKNIIRLILGKRYDDDTETRNQYTRARDYLYDWIVDSTLVKSGVPAFWVYEQEFTLPDIGKRRVKGFIGRVRLSDYDEGRILPHEKVLKNPVEDRIQLTKTTNTQLEYIWSLYEDREKTIDSLLEIFRTDKGIIDYREPGFNKEESVRHRLWRMDDPVQCAAIHEAMGKSRIYIADGHHRYATMLHIRDYYRDHYPDAGPDAPWEFILMYLVNYEHEGLTIRPTHRMLHHLSINQWDRVFTDIETHFHVKQFPWNNDNEKEVRKKWLSVVHTKQPGEHSFGLYIKEKNSFYLLTLKDTEAYKELVRLDHSSEWKLLDVNIVNYLLLQGILGITEEDLSLNTKVGYITDPDEGVEKVKRGEMEGVVILNPTRLGDVITISENREMMPRKSTYFYPKPLSGLVMYPMEWKAPE